MAVERIDRADDDRIAAYREVPDPELVRSRGLFVAEGRLVVRRVIEDRRYRVRSVLVSETAKRSLSATLDTLPPHVPVYICDVADLAAITGYNLHRGCLALVDRPPVASIAEVLAEARTLVVLEAVANADNVGGVFRNAAALGGDALLLSPTCCDPLYRKAIRTSMGAVLRVPYARADEWPGALAHVRAAGFRLVALTPRAPAELVETVAARTRGERVALILGTEGEGLSAAVEAFVDLRARIPISPTVDSLNVSVAAGIALYAFRAAR